MGRRLHITLVYMALYVCVGVPVWLHTTTTYRAPLVTDDDAVVQFLASVRESPPRARVDMELVVCGGADMGPLAESVVPLDAHAEARIHARESRDDDAPWCEQREGAYAAKGPDTPFAFHAYVTLDTALAVDHSAVLVGAARALHVRTGGTLATARDAALAWLGEWARGESDRSAAADGVRMSLADEYVLSLALLHEDPLTTGTPTWNMTDTSAHFWEPLAALLADVATFRVHSQHVYFAPLERVLRHAPDREHIPLAALTHVLTAEWVPLLRASTLAPHVHLVAMLPRAPTHIAERGQDGVDAIVVPQWGGLLFVNEVAPATRSLAPATLHHITGVFVAQLRTLLGLSEQPPAPRTMLDGRVAVRDVPARGGVAAWEADQLAARRLYDRVRATAATLLAFREVVASIPNMVVRDELAARVGDAVQRVQGVVADVRAGRVRAAARAAQSAHRDAEAAFADHSMLSVLYFPEEHKWAIYVPLFVPITLPLVLGLVREGKRAWRKGKAKEE